MNTTNPTQDVRLAWWASNLEEVDREIARLAIVCQVRILEPGVIERVLRKDASACGTGNRAAFVKLRALLMVHYVIREKSVGAFGQSQTTMIEASVVDRLKKRFGERLGA